MWKCFNRGVWETIDRSVIVFKADTSNGTCLISSLAKDLDGKNEECTKHKPQIYNEDKVGVCHVTEGLNLCHEHQARRRIVNRRNVKFNSRFTTDLGDLRHSRTVTTSQTLDTSQAPAISKENIRTYNDCHQKPVIVNSCIRNTISGKCDRECSCDKRLSPDSDYISESHLIVKDRILYPVESSEGNAKWKEQPCKSIGLPEEREELYLSTSKLREACKSSFFSLYSKVRLLCGTRDVKEEKVITRQEEVQPQDLVCSNSHAKTNCMLKLPFLCYDLGRYKGVNKVSALWLMKPISEFGRGDNGGPDGEQNGESEETKEDTWRQCQKHQSFLEAIGWSSAVLFGWFLGHFRFWNQHGEIKRDNSEIKEECCVIGSMAKLLVNWRGNTALPLKVLPIKKDEVSRMYTRKKGVEVNGSETIAVNDPYGDCPSNPYLVLENEEHFCNRHSTSNYLIQQKSENASSHKSHLERNLYSISGTEKSNAIPIPWHVDTVNNLKYGPITLDEAIKEAGKGLEEAQAEVLLTLALKKLDEGDSSSSTSEPLPANLFQSAASLGSAAAAFNLGICFEKGVGGVVKNLVQAYHWYKQASDQGHAAATYNLAVFHANGLGGLHCNKFLADKLLLKASTLGLEEATNALSYISSFNSSERFHNNNDSLYFRDQASDDLSNNVSSNMTPNMSKSHSSTGVKNKQDTINMYCESCHSSSNDHTSITFTSDGTISQPLEHFKVMSKVSQRIDHHLMSHDINLSNSVDTDRPLLGELMLDDHHCIKNIDNSLVQLLTY